MPGGKHKGIGYMIEAIVATLTILIFAVGSVSSPPDHDWNQFQNQIESQDISYVLEQSGHMNNFLQRSETGSIRTAANTLSGNMEVSGTVQNLPIRRSVIGFHTLQNDIYGFDTVDASAAPDNRCYTSNDLEEIVDNSEGNLNDIKRTENERHGVYLYFADTDPRISAGYDGVENYDSVWVDNGTRCQFSASEGPHYIDDFFFWGNTSDAEADDHYDFKNISYDGSSFVVYNATQVVRFRNTMSQPLNGINTDTHFDTFNFSINDLDVYRVLVFRRQQTLNTLDTNPERTRLLDYLKTGSALFLMDIDQSDITSGFMSETGMEWIDLDWGAPPSRARFSNTRNSEDVETYFLGQNGNDNAVSLDPGGNISSSTGDTKLSGEKLAYAGTGRYQTSQWNATNMSMDSTASPLPGSPSPAGCSNYKEGTFSFPAGNYDIVATELGETSCSDIWSLSIDLNGNGQIEQPREGPYVNGELLEVDGRSYSVRIYPLTTPGCSEGECAEFITAGSDRIEIVNHRTKFETQEIEKFARAGYEPVYNTDERKLLASVIYWLAGDETNFGPEEASPTSTSVVGGIKNTIYMPYKVNLRWKQ